MPFSLTGPSTCHQLPSRWLKSRSGKSAASSVAGLPMLQLQFTHSRCRGINDQGFAPAKNSLRRLNGAGEGRSDHQIIVVSRQLFPARGGLLMAQWRERRIEHHRVFAGYVLDCIES